MQVEAEHITSSKDHEKHEPHERGEKKPRINTDRTRQNTTRKVCPENKCFQAYEESQEREVSNSLPRKSMKPADHLLLSLWKAHTLSRSERRQSSGDVCLFSSLVDAVFRGGGVACDCRRVVHVWVVVCRAVDAGIFQSGRGA